MGVRLGAAGSGLLSRAAGLGIEGLEIRVDGLGLIDSMSHNVVNSGFCAVLARLLIEVLLLLGLSGFGSFVKLKSRAPTHGEPGFHEGYVPRWLIVEIGST